VCLRYLETLKRSGIDQIWAEPPQRGKEYGKYKSKRGWDEELGDAVFFAVYCYKRYAFVAYTVIMVRKVCTPLAKDRHCCFYVWCAG
jgi:hypothetical protein